uniref:Bradykinin-potentiating peptide Phypo Xa n=2 Tax=Phyllomedusinae TaxID=192732 RepID=BPPXA_PHAJA|nr:RecName: Full=Bradykinin-potentiating peptide Phypo Xa; Short=BPP [Pithecopus hypochondrialis]P86643.1 RecName: Full=Bradykinin-potentiating peptide Phypo Xa; Short=BPP [Phasmahyla jandaia]
QFRPSYQIPP